MKILQVHNAYQHIGGEEMVVAAEKDLLTEHGHDVKQWIVENSDLADINPIGKASVALGSIWSNSSYKKAKKIIKAFQPDVVHVHNTIPQISPSIYTACQALKVPVIHSIHNYKLICPGAYLYRDNGTCEDCIGKFIPTSGLVHGCYRNSRLQTLIATLGLVANKLRGTFSKDVDMYIALTRFARQKFIEGGLPPEKIAIKPNFVASDIQPGQHKGNYALFVGKLVQYKGIETILRAWDYINEEIPIKIVGQGPLEVLLKSNLPKNVEYLGRLPREEVLALMQNAKMLVFPSEWYEGFPMTIVEAFATATPVIAAKCGASGEIVRDGKSGWHFTPQDHLDLARVVQSAWSDPEELDRRGGQARKQYDDNYSSEQNYKMLMSIYETAVSWSKGRDVLSVF